MGNSLTFSFVSGTYLPRVKDDFEEFQEAFPVLPKYMLAIYQAVLNLCGESDDNLAILSEDFKSHPGYTTGIPCLCRYLSYMFQDYTAALSFTEHIERDVSNQTVLFYQHGYTEFYDGLVSLALARYDEDHEKWIEKANKSISEIRLKSIHSTNCLNKLSLLEAELAAAHCDIENAEACYVKAISLSRQFEFINEEALACERAGLFFLEMNSLEKACQYLLQSYNCYKEWGAVAKMEHLIEIHPFLQDVIDDHISDVAEIMENVNLGYKTDRSRSSISLLSQGKNW